MWFPGKSSGFKYSWIQNPTLSQSCQSKMVLIISDISSIYILLRKGLNLSLETATSMAQVTYCSTTIVSWLLCVKIVCFSFAFQHKGDFLLGILLLRPYILPYYINFALISGWEGIILREFFLSIICWRYYVIISLYPHNNLS